MKKKKILLLSDDIRTSSGVASMSREIIIGTIDKYDWIQLAAGVNHPDLGYVIDLNEDLKKRTGVEDAKCKLYPSTGYGDINTLRNLIETEKPDALLHFTDPHNWIWLYQNEHEIRRQIPILYYHVWDNLPDPLYNRNYYESCDWIGCISKQTYGIVNRVAKLDNEITFNPLKDNQISYVPHGVNPNTFKPIENKKSELMDKINPNGKYDFILFFNSKNTLRKNPANLIYSYKLFCDSLPKEKSKKCLLLMHTNIFDEHGTNLYDVAQVICPNYDIYFHQDVVESEVINELYNISDCTINISCNEGFGLTTIESLMAGTPIIVNVTGGLQDQCGFKDNTGKQFTAEDYIKIGSLHDKNWENKVSYGEWVIPIWSSVQTLTGSIPTPYIFYDHLDNTSIVNAIKEVYEMGSEKRKEIGLQGRDWSINNFSNKIMCEKLSEGIDLTIKNFQPKKRFNLYKII